MGVIFSRARNDLFCASLSPTMILCHSWEKLFFVTLVKVSFKFLENWFLRALFVSSWAKKLFASSVDKFCKWILSSAGREALLIFTFNNCSSSRWSSSFFLSSFWTACASNSLLVNSPNWRAKISPPRISAMIFRAISLEKLILNEGVLINWSKS